MPIKAIYFDLGGVIVRTGDKTARTQLAAEFGMTYDQMDAFVFGCESAALATLGTLTEEQHWQDVTRRLNLPLSETGRIRDTFFGGDSVDWEIVAFLRSMRKTHKTGLISNAWNGLRPYMEREKFADAFDALTISAEVGVMKPDPAIFQHALDQVGVKPKEAVFVDDVIENITGCEVIGMRGIHFKSTEQTLKDLKKMLK
jgi:epoxide hydrolase-like predicted phosphatase